MLVFHIIIALTSVAYSTYLYSRPSKKKFYVTYSLVGLTLLSGGYLIWQTHAPMLQACTTGLIYIGVILVSAVPAHVKLARASARRHID